MLISLSETVWWFVVGFVVILSLIVVSCLVVVLPETRYYFLVRSVLHIVFPIIPCFLYLVPPFCWLSISRSLFVLIFQLSSYRDGRVLGILYVVEIFLTELFKLVTRECCPWIRANFSWNAVVCNVSLEKVYNYIYLQLGLA